MSSVPNSCQIVIQLEFFRHVLEKDLNYLEVHPLGAELLNGEERTDRQTDRQRNRHDETNM